MGFTISQQAGTFAAALGFGLCLGVAYDLLRLWRREGRLPFVPVLLLDLLYFALYTFSTFLFLMDQCSGELRPYVLLGQLLGAVFWLCTLSRPFLKLGQRIVGVAKGGGGLLFKVTVLPLLVFSRKIAAVLERAGRFLKKNHIKLHTSARIDLKKAGHMLYNQDESTQVSSDMGKAQKRRGFLWKVKKRRPSEKPTSC